ncbi:feruloyl esterase [Aspergillus venezuelensis]
MALFSPTQVCAPSTFSALSLFGAEILAVDADITSNYNFPIPGGWRFSQPSVNVQNATFCNVTVTYTHPGQDDIINAEIWLPLTDWNGRLQAVGGGGWTAGRFVLSYAGMAGAIYDGYATATTDAGVGNSPDPGSWGLVSPGNLNLAAFDNFGQRSLNDLAAFAKQVVEAFYDQPPLYSYWNGCSNGGRQASILAQQCEMAQLTALATAECDALDGVEDGFISDPDGCRAKFNPQDHVGTVFTCTDTGTETSITAAAVDVARAIFEGARFSNGDFMWYGYEVGTDLEALAAATCAEDGDCTPTSRASLSFWWQFFVLKNPSSAITTLTHAQFDQLFLALKKELAPIAATEPRITAFQNAGGKMITFHGLLDAAITPESTLHYFKEVSSVIDGVADFYQYYRIPGLEHCFGGRGGQPIHLFDQLRSWVETGTAPGASAVTIRLPDNSTMDQVVCPYPQSARYEPSCSSESSEECWRCE